MLSCLISNKNTSTLFIDLQNVKVAQRSRRQGCPFEGPGEKRILLEVPYWYDDPELHATVAKRKHFYDVCWAALTNERVSLRLTCMKSSARVRWSVESIRGWEATKRPGSFSHIHRKNVLSISLRSPFWTVKLFCIAFKNVFNWVPGSKILSDQGDTALAA